MGTASLVIGIFSLFFSFLPGISYIALLPAIVGLSVGIIEIINSRNKGKKPNSSEVAGTIINSLALINIIILSLFLYQGYQKLNDILEIFKEEVTEDQALPEETFGQKSFKKKFQKKDKGIIKKRNHDFSFGPQSHKERMEIHRKKIEEMRKRFGEKFKENNKDSLGDNSKNPNKGEFKIEKDGNTKIFKWHYRSDGKSDKNTSKIINEMFRKFAEGFGAPNSSPSNLKPKKKQYSKKYKDAI